MAGFRNPFEARVAAQLGPAYEYEAIRLSYTVERTYTPDFVNHERRHIVESKGYWRAEDRQKMLAVKRANPEYTYELIFHDPGKTIAKNSKTTYRAWAEKHGFLVGSTPPKR